MRPALQVQMNSLHCKSDHQIHYVMRCRISNRHFGGGRTHERTPRRDAQTVRDDPWALDGGSGGFSGFLTTFARHQASRGASRWSRIRQMNASMPRSLEGFGRVPLCRYRLYYRELLICPREVQRSPFNPASRNSIG